MYRSNVVSFGMLLSKFEISLTRNGKLCKPFDFLLLPELDELDERCFLLCFFFLWSFSKCLKVNFRRHFDLLIVDIWPQLCSHSEYYDIIIVIGIPDVRGKRVYLHIIIIIHMQSNLLSLNVIYLGYYPSWTNVQFSPNSLQF